ncbi:MAG: thiamine S protein [Planctomycetaceae bacterium]|nr:thiamine S protein [Planctomycetaceae bacterium]
MPTVFVPPLMRTLTNGVERVEVQGATVRQALAALEVQYPGVTARLCKDHELLPGMAVGIDGHLSTLGLRQKVQPNSEIHFLPAIGGG